MKQNTAIITGASDGIGAAMSKLLIQHGWKVVAISRNFKKLEFLKNNLLQNKKFLKIYSCDVKDYSKLKMINFLTITIV